MSVGGLNTKTSLTNALEVGIELARRADLCACPACVYLRAIGKAGKVERMGEEGAWERLAAGNVERIPRVLRRRT